MVCFYFEYSYSMNVIPSFYQPENITSFLDCPKILILKFCIVCVCACVSINVIMVNLNDIPIIVWCTIYNYVSYMQWTWVFWLFFITLDFLICFVILVCELIFCGNLTSWVSQGILVFLWSTFALTHRHMAPRASQVALVVKNLPANAGDVRDSGLLSGSGRSPGGRHCNPLQYSCLENPVDRGTWQARVEKHQTQLKQLRTHTRTLTQSDHGVMTWLFTHWWSSHACWWFPSRPLMQRDSAPSYRQPWVCLGPWIHKSCLNCCSFGHWTLPPLLQVPKGNLLKV